jgi:hypothetical protein
MAAYEIRIIVDVDGSLAWQHCAQEWHLSASQKETVSDLHTAYKSVQRALEMQQRIIDSNAALRALKERAG